MITARKSKSLYKSILYKSSFYTGLYKHISYLLITTILFVAFLPAHYHLHHLYDESTTSPAASAHEHVIDLHILIDDFAQSHHDDESTSIAATPDGIVKNSSADFYPFILLSIALLLIPSFNLHTNFALNLKTNNVYQRRLYYTPLLRAPPQT